jgi:hypothetical protein
LFETPGLIVWSGRITQAPPLCEKLFRKAADGVTEGKDVAESMLLELLWLE